MDNISGELEQMTVFLDHYRMVAPLKQMATERIPSVYLLGVDAVEVPHAPP